MCGLCGEPEIIQPAPVIADLKPPAVKPDPPAPVAAKPDPPAPVAAKPDPPAPVAVKPDPPAPVAVKPDPPAPVVADPKPAPSAPVVVEPKPVNVRKRPSLKPTKKPVAVSSETINDQQVEMKHTDRNNGGTFQDFQNFRWEVSDNLLHI